MNKFYHAVAITTGDKDGIGLEVTAKSLFKLGPQRDTHFFIFRDSKQEAKQKKYFNLIDKKFNRFTFNSTDAAIAFYSVLRATNSLDKKFIFDLSLSTPAVDWVIQSTDYCKKSIFASLVTGPISKTHIVDSGYNYIGHTGIFKKFYPKNNLFMGFIGKEFNVVIATDHIALKIVESKLNKKLVVQAIAACIDLKNLTNDRRPICVLGLNPHAGENGIIGSYEKLHLNKLISKNKCLVGPISPDAAFFKSNWKKYSSFLALYHDQGLIPFKMVHGQDSGVHITLGLPFVRTSVDHGTAKNIFNKNMANSHSMRDAILLNLKLLKNKVKIKVKISV